MVIVTKQIMGSLIMDSTMQPEYEDCLAWLILVDIIYFTWKIISKTRSACKGGVRIIIGRAYPWGARMH